VPAVAAGIGAVAALRPTNAPRRRLGGEHLAHWPPAAHVVGAAPLVHGHEQRSPIRAAEDAGETATVQVDHLEHLAALAHAHAALVAAFSGRLREQIDLDTLTGSCSPWST
jgi:hypothetical protein